ncbi:SGNH/GDSL hydrolase family protein [Pseudomonas sp. Gutcm_11s]|uniref:SGNH/GDSL hydrolase family protein n=1 Tax=Pseudomonas sp. Gutcm_11s TaxID=3026088 RepID=UPI00236159E3|nr:SGNH/GDSL hydrolase family protein [Pseudomonas sp. Gutcm_11s]MDD0841563.1 SGNH/GDSL hydrolase family protein [Pseudomonas sp. Gutcm_11s]
MSRLRAGLWWGLLLALAPIALPQALWTRRTALRLPEAAGAQSGLAGVEWAGEPLRLLLIGESTVAGVGVEAQEAALAGQLAQALAARLGRPVAWRACGENGITAGEACERLLPLALSEPADLVLLVFGVNDTTHLSSLTRWQQSLRALSRALSARGERVVFTGVPPIQHFSALPWLLRQLLGRRAALLDAELRQVSAEERATYAPVALRFSPDYLARDGYHPSALGYRVWAEQLAERLSESR